MDPHTLRARLLQHVAAHQATGASAYREDTALAASLDVPLDDVHRQIRILESHGFLTVAASFGPSYSVWLTPAGELAAEQAAAPDPPPATPIGF